MAPSMRSALWIVGGIFTVAAAVGLLVGMTAEWGVITGAMGSGQSFDLVLVIEAVLVLLVVVLLMGTMRQPRPR